MLPLEDVETMSESSHIKGAEGEAAEEKDIF